MTQRIILITLMCLCSVIFFSGCMSYTTLQSPKTLEPSQVILGAGFSMPVESGSSSVMYEFNTRVGIVQRFDVGAKFVAGSLYVLDGKYQFLREPINVSADLAWSHYSYSGIVGSDKGKTTAWYPMIIAGQDHWYVALKQVYLSVEGEVQFLGTLKFAGTGLASTNIVVGAVLGDEVRFIPEINMIMWRGGQTTVVPAVGLQFVF